jgi:hypothetical protein
MIHPVSNAYTFQVQVFRFRMIIDSLTKRISYLYVLYPSYDNVKHSKFSFRPNNFILLSLILEPIYLLPNLKIIILSMASHRLLLTF